MKIAFLFSGQGAQYVGMGKQLYDEFPIYRRTCDIASEALGYSISDVMFNDEKKLSDTEFCQPAILTMSIAITEILKEKGVEADMAAGLSLGEYTALTYGGAYNFRDAVALVQKRGRFMREAVEQRPGSMCAILGGDAPSVDAACRNVSTSQSPVYVANYNAPDQIVISGAHDAVRLASMAAQQMGAKRAIMLNVAGAFHTPLLTPAADALKEELVKLTPNNLRIPVISNVDADVIRYVGDLPNTLHEHMIAPVRFYQSVQTMIDKAVTVFMEIGPGKSLTSFVKRTNNQALAVNVEDLRTLNEALKKIS